MYLLTDYTDWISGLVPPIRIGVYQRKHTVVTVYSYWNGFVWCLEADNPISAYDFRIWASKRQTGIWRGLTRDHSNNT